MKKFTVLIVGLILIASASVLIPLGLVIFLVILDDEDLDMEGGFSPDAINIGTMSPHVLQYQDMVAKYAKKNGISQYTPVILAIMQQESGGLPSITDPMQSSESLCGRIGCITNPEHSIQQGVKYFKSVLDRANDDVLLAIQSYNFGGGFIDYVKSKKGKYKFNKTVGNKKTYDLAIKFSQEQYKRQVGMGNGGMFTCLRAESKQFNACFGDIMYAWSVSQHMNLDVDSDGKGGMAISNPGSGSFIMPINNAPITSGFGGRSDPFGNNASFHGGIDLGVPRGTKVGATADGVVIQVQNGCIEGSLGCGGGWGNHVLLRHKVKGVTYDTVYAHLTSATVKEGQKIKKGGMVGKSGNTGRSTGPHLHFEIHKNGFRNPINPLSVVSK